MYIGKTEFSIEKRFKEHCQDSKKDNFQNRPLYAAMRKYGIEHFYIELLEETDNPEEREIFWIEYFGSFKNGYNATIGGDGKKYIDYDLVVATYNQVQNIIETAKICNCSEASVSRILECKQIVKKTSQYVNKEKFSTVINQYSKDNRFIQSFPSIKEAARFIRPDTSSLGGVTSHISDVCKKKRKSAYGYIWKYAE